MPKSSFKFLEDRMGDWIIPEDERKEHVDSDISEYEWHYGDDGDDDMV